MAVVWLAEAAGCWLTTRRWAPEPPEYVSALLEIAERITRGEQVSPDEYPPIPPSPDGGPIDHPVEMLP